MGNNKTPLSIGITGGIGAGKSTVAKVFSILGIPIYDADSRAKWLMTNSKSLKKRIIQHFGDLSFEKGILNRTYLAKRVFGHAEQTALLNSLVHPEVANDFCSWVGSQTRPYVLKEAALLYEAGSYKDLDKTILVSAPEEIRIQRVLKRDSQRSESDIKNIISRQWSETRKKELADFSIRNDGTSLVIPQVLAIHKKLMTEV